MDDNIGKLTGNNNLKTFYDDNSTKMDQSRFKSKTAKLYNYLYNKFKYKPSFNELKRDTLEKFKYEINCVNKPKPYEISGNEPVNKDSLAGLKTRINEISMIIDHGNESLDKIIKEETDISLNEIIDNYDLNAQNIRGISDVIKELEKEIENKRAIVDNTRQGLNTMDEYIQNNYNNYDEEGNKIENNQTNLFKKQKEYQIYEYFIYITYFFYHHL